LIPPQQKEPKLSRARQIPEWDEYDREIAQFARKLAEDGILRSRFAAADANVLAGAGDIATTDAKPIEITKHDAERQHEKTHQPDEL
jgi:UDP-glucose:glycoprotein glucosyltransferase